MFKNVCILLLARIENSYDVSRQYQSYTETRKLLICEIVFSIYNSSLTLR